MDFLRRFVALAAGLDVSRRCFLAFLLERVEYIDTLFKFGQVEYPESVTRLDTDFIDAGAYRWHRFEVARLVPSLDGSQFKSRIATRLV
jgi:hypothetical protein